MKKTFNINICGVGFTIDDDAFTLLDDYLETLRHAFAATPEGSELMRDIEGRVAELLCDRPGGRGAIVTAEEVKEVIARIGQAEQFSEVDEETVINGNYEEKVEEKEKVSDTPPPYIPPLKRKLFRDPNDRLIGGVCGGVAAYLNVDVTWVRLATIALCFLSLSTVAIAYVILWIVLPEAITPIQQMQMRGEQATMENIARTVTGESANDYQQRKSNFGNALSTFFSTVLKVILVFIGIIAVPLITALAICFICCIIALIAAFTGWGSEFFLDNTNSALLQWSDARLPLMCALFWILTSALPLILLVFQLISSKTRRSYIGRRWRWAFVVVWLLSIIGAGITTAIVSSDDFKGDSFHIKIERDNDDWEPDCDAGAEEFDNEKMVTKTDTLITIQMEKHKNNDSTKNTIKITRD